MPDLTPRQREVLAERRIASVATVGRDGTPHLTATWFLFDGDSFLIAIPSSSVKARNLRRSPQIAIMVDVRQTGQELGISASGIAEVLEGQGAREATARVHAKYLTGEALSDPQVGPAFAALDDVAVRLEPKRWITWDMSALDQRAFGGKLAARSYLRSIRV